MDKVFNYITSELVKNQVQALNILNRWTHT